MQPTPTKKRKPKGGNQKDIAVLQKEGEHWGYKIAAKRLSKEFTRRKSNYKPQVQISLSPLKLTMPKRHLRANLIFCQNTPFRLVPHPSRTNQ